MPQNDELDRRSKIWNRLLQKRSLIEVKAITIIDSPVFAPQRIELERIVAFIGLHGTGKSLLLRTIQAAFGFTAQDQLPPFLIESNEYSTLYPPGIAGIVDVEVQTADGYLRHRIDLSVSSRSRAKAWSNDLPESYGPVHASPVSMLAELGMLYQEYSGIDRTHGSDKRYDLRQSQVKAMNNILGKSYDRIRVEPRPFLANEVAYAAYVTAYSGDKETDSAAMSLGELWVHHTLHYSLSTEADENDLVLLDEPESFLAARAQRPFIDEVARIALAKNLQVLIGTHSPDILARFPLSNIRMCVRSSDGIRVVTPRSIGAIREVVGVETAIRLIILVEDDTAREILRLILARFDLALTRECEVVAAGGEAMVIRGLQVLRNASRLRSVGILDADQRYRAEDNDLKIFYLPGDGSPETELISVAIRNPRRIAKRLSRTSEDVETAISLCEGREHQYRLNTIAEFLGLAESELRYELAQLWLREQRISRQAERLVLKIRSLIF